MPETEQNDNQIGQSQQSLTTATMSSPRDSIGSQHASGGLTHSSAPMADSPVYTIKEIGNFARHMLYTKPDSQYVSGRQSTHVRARNKAKKNIMELPSTRSQKLDRKYQEYKETLFQSTLNKRISRHLIDMKEGVEQYCNHIPSLGAPGCQDFVLNQEQCSQAIRGVYDRMIDSKVEQLADAEERYPGGRKRSNRETLAYFRKKVFDEIDANLHAGTATFVTGKDTLVFTVDTSKSAEGYPYLKMPLPSGQVMDFRTKQGFKWEDGAVSFFE